MYKLLLVEDEKLIRRGLADHNPWSEWGFECVGEAENGMEALSLFAQHHPDVLLTDLRMPAMDGLTLLSKLRNKGINCPVIIISGHADFDYAQRAIRYGVMAYLLKPIKQQELKNAFMRVRKFLGESQPIHLGAHRSEDIAIEPVLSFIEANYHFDIRIQQLADIAHLSVSQLTRIFKMETGESIVKYINSVRVDVAKKLLRDTSLKIFEVADQVGFDDVSYFCRVFKGITNYSPTEYRENEDQA